MAYAASQLVAIAVAELGYKEKSTNANLDSATGNAGSNNWTKYARDLAAAGYYNGGKNGFAWCDVFVDWCFYQMCGKNALKAQALECQTGNLGAACNYSKGYYKAAGRLFSSPKVGDQVFFQSGGTIVHTGIVETVFGTGITTIEGNSGNKVARHSYAFGNSYIDSFGRPKYDAVDTTQGETQASEAGKQKQPVTIDLSELQYGAAGCQVKTVQRIIRAKGLSKNLVVDGQFGPLTKAGVVVLQKKLFPDDATQWDGIVGKRTWLSMLTELD